MEDTLVKVIIENYRNYGDNALAMRKKEYGIWKKYTWKDYCDNVKYFSLGMISLGLRRGDKVCFIGENAPEYFWSQYGVQAAGAVATGCFSDSVPKELAYIFNDSESRFLIAEDQEQVDKALEIKDQLPTLEKIICWDPKGLVHYNEPLLMQFKEVLKLGRDYEREHPDTFEQNLRECKGEDVACLLYTSGTGGVPKAAMMPNSSLVNCGRLWNKIDPWSPSDEYVSFISPAWVGEQGMMSVALIGGAKVNFPEEIEAVRQNVREIGASQCVFNPRLWEGIVTETRAKMLDANFINRFIYSLFLPVGYKVSDLCSHGKKLNLFWAILHRLAHYIVFRPILDSFGLLKMKSALTGGAAIGIDSFRFLRAVGVSLRQLFASTEVPGTTLQRSDEIKFESVGTPVTEIELRILDSGEILARGPTMFKGYYKNPAATQKALGGGWFHTGDAGFIDRDGHLIYLGRLDDLFEADTTGAPKISPEYIEGRLKFSPYIRDAMVIGGKGKPYLVALIQIDFETMGRWAETRKLPYTTFMDLSQKQEVYDLTKKELERINKSLPPPSRIKKYSHLHKEFDADEAELTRTRKLRRGYLEERYNALIGAMYAENCMFEIKSQVKYRDGREGTIQTAIKIVSLDSKEEKGG